MIFFFSSRRRHTIFKCDWSSDACSSDLKYSLLSGGSSWKRWALRARVLHSPDTRRFFMRARNIAIFSAAVVAGAIVGSAVGPRPAQAVARELIELQHDVTTLLQGQKDLSTQMTQDHTVMKTLVEQSGESVGKLNGTMSALQKSMQDVTANSGARLDTMSTHVQALSDNLEAIKSRLGKLNQQLVDLQNTVQSLDAKISGGGGAGATPPAANSGGGMISQPSSTSLPPSGAAGGGGPAPSADTLYSNGLRDITGGNYDLA